jgi:hypothetical protein
VTWDANRARGRRARGPARLASYALALVLLTGCASTGEIAPAPDDAPNPAPAVASATPSLTPLGEEFAEDLQRALDAATTSDPPVVATSAPVSRLEVVDLGSSYLALWTPVTGATGYQVARLGVPAQTVGPDDFSYSWVSPSANDPLADATETTISAQFVFVHAMSGEQILRTFVGSVGCPDWAFVAARGSGQNLPVWSTYAKALGARGNAVWELVKDRAGLDDEALPALAVDYPAVGVGFRGGALAPGTLGPLYRDSVEAGVTAANLAVYRTLTACPDTRLILFGYSQGAQVIGDAYAGLDPRARAHVAMVVLFADPLYTPGDYQVAYRPTPLAGSGIKGERSRFPLSTSTILQSWCAPRDAVCQRPPAGYEQHGPAYDAYESQVADEIVDLLDRTEPWWAGQG